MKELSGTIHVWYCSFSKNESRLSRFERLLSKDEKKRAANYKFEKDRDSFIISRGIVRELLGDYLGVSPSEIKFRYTTYGKPYLPNNNLKFNISHSGDMAAFTFVIGAEIGIDIEEIKKDLDVLELARNFFSKDEILVLEQFPTKEQCRAFYRCWTRKESFIKAEGSGLSFPLDKFTVSLANDNQADLLKTDWDSAEKPNWSLFSFAPNKQFILAVALSMKLDDIQYFDWDVVSLSPN